MNEKNFTSKPKWEQRITLFLGVALLLLYAYHFFEVWTYAVNVPFWDEWAVFGDGALSRNFDASWIWAQHNEHRMLTNKLLIWVLYRLNGWDIGAHQSLNFLLYGGLIWSSLAVARRVAPKMPLWILLSFAFYLLSPLNHENHAMAFESSFHFVILFSLLATLLLFRTSRSGADEYSNQTLRTDAQSWRDLVLGVVCAILSIYSLGNGLFYALAMLMVFAVFKITRARRVISPHESRREWSQLLVVAFCLLMAMALWFVGWNNKPGDVARESPLTAKFWTWWFNVVSSGFGFETYAVWAGVACLIFLIAPLLMPLFRRDRALPVGYWMLFSLVLGLILVLLSVASGRTNYQISFSKTPRYTQFVFLLLPSVVAGWWLLLENVKLRFRIVTIGALWLFCFFSFLNDWSYFRYYGDKFLERQAGFECVARYYQTEPTKEWRCRSIAPFPINRQLANARRLNASFYRDARDFDPRNSIFRR